MSYSRYFEIPHADADRQGRQPGAEDRAASRIEKALLRRRLRRAASIVSDARLWPAETAGRRPNLPNSGRSVTV
jgi:hypothetical protein